MNILIFLNYSCVFFANFKYFTRKIFLNFLHNIHRENVAIIVKPVRNKNLKIALKHSTNCIRSHQCFFCTKKVKNLCTSPFFPIWYILITCETYKKVQNFFCNGLKNFAIGKKTLGTTQLKSQLAGTWKYNLLQRILL